MSSRNLRLALPKGRMERGVLDLLGDAGIGVSPTERGYRPAVTLPDTDTKLLKSQNIVEMLMMGRRDVGFAGADWVAEFDADLVEVVDCALDPVRVVVCGGPELAASSWQTRSDLLVASEYGNLARRWITCKGLSAAFVRSYGATEAFAPDDADLIVDNCATGATLAANGLVVIDEIMTSSTRMYASRPAWEDPIMRRRIEELAMLVDSVLAARRRVMVEANAGQADIERVVAVLPSMREATVSPLYGNGAFAVRAAIPRDTVSAVIPALKEAGASDIVVSDVAQLVP